MWYFLSKLQGEYRGSDEAAAESREESQEKKTSDEAALPAPQAETNNKALLRYDQRLMEKVL